MRVHPYVMLLLVLTKDDLSRETMLDILDKNEPDYEWRVITIGNRKHNFQILDGDLAIYNFVTTGNGDVVEWDKLVRQKEELESWAKQICEAHHLTYKIYVYANHW